MDLIQRTVMLKHRQLSVAQQQQLFAPVPPASFEANHARHPTTTLDALIRLDYGLESVQLFRFCLFILVCFLVNKLRKTHSKQQRSGLMSACSASDVSHETTAVSAVAASFTKRRQSTPSAATAANTPANACTCQRRFGKSAVDFMPQVVEYQRKNRDAHSNTNSNDTVGNNKQQQQHQPTTTNAEAAASAAAAFDAAPTASQSHTAAHNAADTYTGSAAKAAAGSSAFATATAADAAGSYSSTMNEFSENLTQQQQRKQDRNSLQALDSHLQMQLQCRNRACCKDAQVHLQMPPGPRGLPFVGYLPFVRQDIHLTLTSLAAQYGPIYQIYLGNIRVLVLNDASLIRQAFKQPVFSGRPDTQITRLLQGYGIINSGGALWKEQRAFLHLAFRKLGAKSLIGANGLEDKIQTQVKEFINDLSVYADSGESCHVRPILARAVSSVVGSIVMNLTYRKFEEKAKFERLIELMQEGFRLFTLAMPLDFIPIFRFFPGINYAFKKMSKNRSETSAFFKKIADEHRQYLNDKFNLKNTLQQTLDKRNNSTMVDSNNNTININDSIGNNANFRNSKKQVTSSSSLSASHNLELHPFKHQTKSHCQQRLLLLQQQQKQQMQNSTSTSQPPSQSNQTNNTEEQANIDNKLNSIVARDLVDAFIVQQAKHEKDGKQSYFSDQQLIQIMSDIFSAGLETVTSTIEWSILFLILNPNCQRSVQEEIDRVIGNNREPQLEDLSQMPYTEATIYEVLRRSNVVALGNTHSTLDDASLGGYKVPKGTHVLPNLYGIHMNPKLWNEPNKFDPGRFIVNDKAQKPDFFIPFSVGRRMCLGDVLAKMEIFLFLVSLLQKYDLTIAEQDKNSPPQVKGNSGASNAPAAFKVAIKARKVNSH